MAKFILVTICKIAEYENGRDYKKIPVGPGETWVNPEHIVSMDDNGDSCYLTFTDGMRFWTEEGMDEIVDRIRTVESAQNPI